MLFYYLLSLLQHRMFHNSGQKSSRQQTKLICQGTYTHPAARLKVSLYNWKKVFCNLSESSLIMNDFLFMWTINQSTGNELYYVAIQNPELLHKSFQSFSIIELALAYSILNEHQLFIKWTQGIKSEYSSVRPEWPHRFLHQVLATGTNDSWKCPPFVGNCPQLGRPRRDGTHSGEGHSSLFLACIAHEFFSGFCQTFSPKFPIFRENFKTDKEREIYLTAGGELGIFQTSYHVVSLSAMIPYCRSLLTKFDQHYF